MAGGERLFGRGRTEGVHGGDEGYDGRKDGQFLGLGPDLVESHIVPLCFWLRECALVGGLQSGYLDDNVS